MTLPSLALNVSSVLSPYCGIPCWYHDWTTCLLNVILVVFLSCHLIYSLSCICYLNHCYGIRFKCSDGPKCCIRDTLHEFLTACNAMGAVYRSYRAHEELIFPVHTMRIFCAAARVTTHDPQGQYSWATAATHSVPACCVHHAQQLNTTVAAKK